MSISHGYKCMQGVLIHAESTTTPNTSESDSEYAESPNEVNVFLLETFIAMH